MMRACDLFDKYRDGELEDSARNAFTSHLATCEECRMRMALLNNLVSVLRLDSIQTSDISDRIAQKAFQKASSWDALVASLFKPRFAVAAAGLILALFSFLWFVPENQSRVSYTEYEILLNQADASNLAGKLLIKNDNELVLQFMQGGDIQ
jgi:anti-sigma factor RsiW